MRTFALKRCAIRLVSLSGHCPTAVCTVGRNPMRPRAPPLPLNDPGAPANTRFVLCGEIQRECMPIRIRAPCPPYSPSARVCPRERGFRLRPVCSQRRFADRRRPRTSVHAYRRSLSSARGVRCLPWPPFWGGRSTADLSQVSPPPPPARSRPVPAWSGGGPLPGGTSTHAHATQSHTREFLISHDTSRKTSYKPI